MAEGRLPGAADDTVTSQLPSGHLPRTARPGRRPCSGLWADSPGGRTPWCHQPARPTPPRPLGHNAGSRPLATPTAGPLDPRHLCGPVVTCSPRRGPSSPFHTRSRAHLPRSPRGPSPRLPTAGAALAGCKPGHQDGDPEPQTPDLRTETHPADALASGQPGLRGLPSALANTLAPLPGSPGARPPRRPPSQEGLPTRTRGPSPPGPRCVTSAGSSLSLCLGIRVRIGALGQAGTCAPQVSPAAASWVPVAPCAPLCPPQHGA